MTPHPGDPHGPEEGIDPAVGANTTDAGHDTADAPDAAGSADTAVTPTEDEPPRRPWWRRHLRWIVGALLVVVLGVELVLIWPELHESVRNLSDLHWQWVGAAILASVFEMWSFAKVQRILLSAAGIRVRQRDSLAVAFAANSMSVTLPGGPVIGTTFTYRQMRNWGASPVVATWQLVMAGLLQAVGLALLGLGGALLVGAATNPFSLVFTAGGLFLVVLLIQYAASRPDSFLAIGDMAIRWFNRVRKAPEKTGVRAWKRIVDQLGAVHLDRPHALQGFVWSALNWLADGACLAFAAYAIGGAPSLAGIAVAYAAGTATSRAIPLLPAGLGVMDAVLVPALTASGMTAVQALSAVVVYRMISFLLVAAIGWIIVAVQFRGSTSDSDEPGPDLGGLFSDDGDDDDTESADSADSDRADCEGDGRKPGIAGTDGRAPSADDRDTRIDPEERGRRRGEA